MKFSIVCLAGLVAASASGQTPIYRFQSPAAKTFLLEAFTSEGCDSCPPAETWLSGYRSSPMLWKEFVPVVFHVDYFDHLGWRDPWSQAAFSERQRRYAGHWGNDHVYTPGFVLNGVEWPDWNRRNNWLAAKRPPAGVLTLQCFDTNRWEAEFVPAPAPALTVHAALLACELTSDVTAGENRGRQLKHDFVALTLVESSLVRQGNRARGEFGLLDGPERKAWAGTWSGALAVAAWVTRTGEFDPLQATGGWLVPPGATAVVSRGNALQTSR